MPTLKPSASLVSSADISRARIRTIGLKTILYKEVHRFLRIWVQTLLPSAITMSLYFVIFGNLIGSRIGTMDGIRYMEYIAPGLIMMAVITNSYSNVASSFFSAKFQHHLEEMLVSPLPNYIILIGYVGGGMARGLLVGALVTVVALTFTELQIENYTLTFVVILQTAAMFSLAGFVNGVFASSFDDVSIVPTFVLTPLTYLGGVFYSTQLLPDIWQNVSLLNPVLYMVNAFRYGMLGVSDIPVHWALLLIAAFTVGLFLLAIRLLQLGIGIRR